MESWSVRRRGPGGPGDTAVSFPAGRRAGPGGVRTPPGLRPFPGCVPCLGRRETNTAKPDTRPEGGIHRPRPAITSLTGHGFAVRQESGPWRGRPGAGPGRQWPRPGVAAWLAYRLPPLVPCLALAGSAWLWPVAVPGVGCCPAGGPARGMGGASGRGQSVAGWLPLGAGWRRRPLITLPTRAPFGTFRAVSGTI